MPVTNFTANISGSIRDGVGFSPGACSFFVKLMPGECNRKGQMHVIFWVFVDPRWGKDRMEKGDPGRVGRLNRTNDGLPAVPVDRIRIP